MKHARTCRNDPARKARIISARARQEAFDKLSPEQKQAQMAANKAAYDAQKSV